MNLAADAAPLQSSARLQSNTRRRVCVSVVVVVAVIAIIFLGLAGYLYRMDRKISALENEK